MPLQNILDKHKINKIDLIHIDAEGFDFKILQQINFEKYMPKLILFEHAHLSQEEKQQALLLLKNHDYTLNEYGGDTLAIHHN